MDSGDSLFHFEKPFIRTIDANVANAAVDCPFASALFLFAMLARAIVPSTTKAPSSLIAPS